MGSKITTCFPDFGFSHCFVHALLDREIAPRPQNRCSYEPISLVSQLYDMIELPSNPWVWRATGWAAILSSSPLVPQGVFTPHIDWNPPAPYR